MTEDNQLEPKNNPDSNEEGIRCPHCGVWNLHEECGTYKVWIPTCKACGEGTEG